MLKPFCSLRSGEFQLRLRQLEKSLLQALNEVKGRILDDDTIITTLENLKKEAAEVTRKVEETDIVMQEVESVSQQYLSLASACSSIYFTMEALNQVTCLLMIVCVFVLIASVTLHAGFVSCADALPVPVLAALLPGHLPHGVIRELQPEERERPHAASDTHHQRPVPGEEPPSTA